MLREALSNVARHAAASEVDVHLVAVGRRLTLCVEDNGIGPPDAPGAGRGLHNMQARAEHLGGTFTLTPRLPSGSRLEWSVPLT